MDNIREKYLNNPCGTLAIPFWKSKNFQIPDNIKVINYIDYDLNNFKNCNIQRFFRLIHNLENININNYICETINLDYDIDELILMMNKSYIEEKITVTKEDINKYTNHIVFNNNLWVCIKVDNKIIASGIAEYDSDFKEGILEWIQVLPEYRSQGYGKIIVNELLKRLKQIGANFVTVSGSLDNKTNPERLYKSCGFTGKDIWYICKKNN